MGQRAGYRRIAPLALAAASLACGGVVAGCSSAQPAPTTSAFSGAAQPAGSWAEPNGDLANTRDAAGSRISSSNVASLKEAWTFKLSGTAATGISYAGSFAAAPVVANGVVYMQDLYANVYAISLATGKLKWEYQVNVPEKSGPGPDGVAVGNGVVYGDTSTTAFALNAATGKVIWSNGSLLNSGQGSFEIQPAVAGGRSIDTSMGLTPLEGLVMGTRSGDVDPALVLHVRRTRNLSTDEIDAVLNSRSGMLALAGDNDMREVQRRVRAGDATAELALDVYCYRIRKYVGAYYAVLGTVDAIVFTAGVGQHSAEVRAAAVGGLDAFGIHLDADRNARSETFASTDDSPVAVLVIPTNEEWQIAREALTVVRRS